MLLMLFILSFFIISVCKLVGVICFNVKLCIIRVSVWLFVMFFIFVIIGISIVRVIICWRVFLNNLINYEVKNVVSKLMLS